MVAHCTVLARPTRRSLGVVGKPSATPCLNTGAASVTHRMNALDTGRLETSPPAAPHRPLTTHHATMPTEHQRFRSRFADSQTTRRRFFRSLSVTIRSSPETAANPPQCLADETHIAKTDFQSPTRTSLPYPLAHQLDKHDWSWLQATMTKRHGRTPGGGLWAMAGGERNDRGPRRVSEIHTEKAWSKSDTHTLAIRTQTRYVPTGSGRPRNGECA